MDKPAVTIEAVWEIVNRVANHRADVRRYEDKARTDPGFDWWRESVRQYKDLEDEARSELWNVLSGLIARSGTKPPGEEVTP